MHTIVRLEAVARGEGFATPRVVTHEGAVARVGPLMDLTSEKIVMIITNTMESLIITHVRLFFFVFFPTLCDLIRDFFSIIPLLIYLCYY